MSSVIPTSPKKSLPPSKLLSPSSPRATSPVQAPPRLQPRPATRLTERNNTPLSPASPSPPSSPTPLRTTSITGSSAQLKPKVAPVVQLPSRSSTTHPASIEKPKEKTLGIKFEGIKLLDIVQDSEQSIVIKFL